MTKDLESSTAAVCLFLPRSPVPSLTLLISRISRPAQRSRYSHHTSRRRRELETRKKDSGKAASGIPFLRPEQLRPGRQPVTTGRIFQCPVRATLRAQQQPKPQQQDSYTSKRRAARQSGCTKRGEEKETGEEGASDDARGHKQTQRGLQNEEDWKAQAPCSGSGALSDLNARATTQTRQNMKSAVEERGSDGRIELIRTPPPFRGSTVPPCQSVSTTNPSFLLELPSSLFLVFLFSPLCSASCCLASSLCRCLRCVSLLCLCCVSRESFSRLVLFLSTSRFDLSIRLKPRLPVCVLFRSLCLVFVFGRTLGPHVRVLVCVRMSL